MMITLNLFERGTCNRHLSYLLQCLRFYFCNAALQHIFNRFKTFVDETVPVTRIFESNGRLRHISSAQTVEAVWEQTKRLFA